MIQFERQTDETTIALNSNSYPFYDKIIENLFQTPQISSAGW